MDPTLKTRQEYLEEGVRRVVAATPNLTAFGENTVNRALLEPLAAYAEDAALLYDEVLNRVLVQNAQDPHIRVIGESRGYPYDTLGRRAQVLVIMTPFTTNAVAVSVVSGTVDSIQVSDGATILVGTSIRIGYTDLSTGTYYTETATVSAKPSANVIRVPTLTTRSAAQYQAAISAGYEVMVTVRTTLSAGTTVTSNGGATFQTLSALTVGDSNPIMAGEGTALGLADKVWCEATERGTAGNIDRFSVIGISPSSTGVVSAYNPERGFGGAGAEDVSAYRQRIIEGPSQYSQDPLAWLLAVGKQVNRNLFRVVKVSTTVLNTVAIKVLKDTGGTFDSDTLSALVVGLEQRSRSGLNFTATNVSKTSIEIEASIQLEPEYTLNQVWRSVSNNAAAYLDFRTWPFGQDPDDAALLSIVRQTAGVANVDTSTFLPASDPAVATDSLPVLTRVSLRNISTGETINASLAVSF